MMTDAEVEEYLQIRVTQDPTMSECFRSAVATALQIPIDELPMMGADVPADDQEPLGDVQADGLSAVLRARGMESVSLPTKRNNRMYPWGICIASGMTPRGYRHSVVWDAGFWWTNPEEHTEGRMIWDPHPSRDGLTEVDEFTCFVVLDPRSRPGQTTEEES